jgi:hypothetical protein
VKRVRLIPWIIGLLAAFASRLDASDTALDRETLRGVKALYVIVSIPADRGLNGQRIQRDVTERLRSADIKVSDLNPSALVLPCLFVSANVLKRQDDSWVYEVSVALHQAVTVAATKMSYMAPTWSVSTLAFASGSAAPEFVGSDINDLTDKFIAAYFAVNRR